MTVQDPDTFLDVRYAKLALVCIRPECSVQVVPMPGAAPRLRDFIIELPERCLPETAMKLRAEHVAKHVQFDLEETKT